MASPSNVEEALTYDTLAVITDRLKLLATRRVEMWWDIGCLLDAMATRGFARGVGIRDYASYAEKVVGIQRLEARRLRRIAHLFSRDVSMRFGVEKLELLVQLVESCYEASPITDPMRVEVYSPRPDGTIQAIPFSECTVDDLRFSIRLMARERSCGDGRFGPEVGALRDEIEAALKTALKRNAPKVKLECDPGKATGHLALLDLQPEAFEAVGRVLLAFGRARAHTARPKPAPKRPAPKKPAAKKPSPKRPAAKKVAARKRRA
jgi:hypothetical protein